MTTKRRTVVAAIALTAALAAAPLTGAFAQKRMQDQEQVYGSQMMTQQEMLEYRQRMRNAKSAEEQERIRAEHHARMQERAKERGIKLPDEPPAMGMGKGHMQDKGMGMGKGGKGGKAN